MIELHQLFAVRKVKSQQAKAQIRQEAIEQLALWLIRYSDMFDFDNAHIHDARATATEVVDKCRKH